MNNRNTVTLAITAAAYVVILAVGFMVSWFVIGYLALILNLLDVIPVNLAALIVTAVIAVILFPRVWRWAENISSR